MKERERRSEEKIRNREREKWKRRDKKKREDREGIQKGALKWKKKRWEDKKVGGNRRKRRK